ncbi:MAG: hypothetical protein IAC77_00640 [Proteobacteria bacterium]|uniref:Type 4 secretion system PilS N-terminal domain-containing protein n=1 Tax=Candidatus Enterousia excrementavium TaxID=2840789 RepID=A0A940IB70_9PROT|nr:hypothetical protein [Candidatus Enterousia excrementavium]
MKYESGRSMVEMIGVLAIMGVITAGAILLINVGLNSSKRTTVRDEVTVLVNEIRNSFSGYDDFSGIGNVNVFTMTGVSQQNPYGGTYGVAVDPSNPRQFIVSINGLTQSECEALKVRTWPGSIGYEMSGHKESGATGTCTNPNGENVVQITFGE